jgi:uncharacterized membrane protein
LLIADNRPSLNKSAISHQKSAFQRSLMKTSSGFDENVAAALSYLVGWVTGVLFLATEPQNSFVRFHAMQSIVVFGAACVAFVVCLSIPFLGWVLSIFVFYGSAALWLILMFKAYQGERFKLPIAGEIAERRVAHR